MTARNMRTLAPKAVQTMTMWAAGEPMSRAVSMEALERVSGDVVRVMSLTGNRDPKLVEALGLLAYMTATFADAPQRVMDLPSVSLLRTSLACRTGGPLWTGP